MNIIRKTKNFILLEMALPIMDKLMKTHVHRYFHEISKMNHWKKAEIDEWQNDKIQKIILHFYYNTVYYKRLLDDLKIDPKSIKTWSDLSKIPPITKDIMREHYDELVPNNLNSISHKNASTGGSSGKTLKYLLDLKSWSYTTSIKIYSWQTTGYLYGDNYATVGSTSLFPQSPSLKHKLYHFFKGSVLISAMNLSDEKIKEHLAVLKKKQVNYIYGYASGIFLIAKYLNKHNLKLECVKGCFSTSEMLTPEYREEIEHAFPWIMDCYGARDGGLTAYEINKGYYNVGYNAIAEVQDCYDTNTGTLLVTDLLNYAFPFIRYEVGDDVKLEADVQHFNGQVLTKIMGRSPDILRLSNGKVLTGPAFQMMFGKLNILAYRIIKSGDLSLTVEIQPSDQYSEQEEKMLVDMIKKQAGSDCEVLIQIMTNFTQNKNGKRNYIMANG